MSGVARLPDSLQLIERGWLSANNVLGFEGERAVLVDSGYVSHAGQTRPLRHALDGRRLERLINTHRIPTISAATRRYSAPLAATSRFRQAWRRRLPSGTRRPCC